MKLDVLAPINCISLYMGSQGVTKFVERMIFSVLNYLNFGMKTTWDEIISANHYDDSKNSLIRSDAITLGPENIFLEW